MNLNPYRAALFTIHERHEVFDGLHEIIGALDDEAFWRLFREAWDHSDSYWDKLATIRAMLSAERLNSEARKLPWTKDELDWMKRALRRGKPVKVYRGASQRNLTGFSWTTKKDIAVDHARRCGYEQGTVVIGRVAPHSIIFYGTREHEVVAFPEHVKIEDTYDVPGLTGQALHARQVQIMVAAKGPAMVMGLSPVDCFMDALEGSKMSKDAAIQNMERCLNLLEKTGFVLRREITREILERLKSGVRGEE